MKNIDRSWPRASITTPFCLSECLGVCASLARVSPRECVPTAFRVVREQGAIGFVKLDRLACHEAGLASLVLRHLRDFCKRKQNARMGGGTSRSGYILAGLAILVLAPSADGERSIPMVLVPFTRKCDGVILTPLFNYCTKA